MAQRLRRSDCTGPGIARRRRGRGFEYRDADGERVDRRARCWTRINELVIPPAWEDVWICPYPGGHIQATGIDDRGRKQYLYHPRWRERRTRRSSTTWSSSRVRCRRCASASRTTSRATSSTATTSWRCAVRLLDRGFFRIGSEDYAVTNETYGLATMRKRHVPS